MKKHVIKWLALSLALLLLPVVAMGEELPYNSYSFDLHKDTVPAPAGYVLRETVGGAAMGTEPLKKPQDFFFHKESRELYIADTENKRVVVVNDRFEFQREYTNAGGENFKRPTGLYVNKQGNIYVADEGNWLVYLMDQQGNLIRKYDRPQSDLFTAEMIFKPQKVVADSAGRVYVLSQGLYEGLICYYEDGTFMSFYGASHVELSWRMTVQKIMRIFQTRTQRAGSEAMVPVAYTNIAIDDEDMIYAVVANSEALENKALVKLNPLGINLLRDLKFGNSNYLDVIPERHGIYTVLDRQFRNVYLFSEDTGHLTGFGGNGIQEGLFSAPVAIEQLDDYILVLDSDFATISVFETTPFGRAINEAMRLYSDGRYEESIEPWREVLRLDNNYAMAYEGLGKAYYQLEDYETAMQYFKLGNFKIRYSDAFQEYTLQLIRQNMIFILLGIVVLFVLFRVKKAYRKRHPKAPKPQTGWRAPFYCMRHPYQGFENVKFTGLGSVRSGAVIIAAFFAVTVFQTLQTGFIFNPNRLDRLNIPVILAVTAGGFLLFYISSVAVSSLMSDCEGRNSELFIVESYALLPYILGTFIYTILTNFVSMEVGAFLTYFMVFYVAWSVILLVVGLFHVNQISFGKTLLNLLLTLVGMLLIVVLIMLLYSLVQQIYLFLNTIYSEIMFRI